MSVPTAGKRRSASAPEVWVGSYRLLSRIGEGGMGVVHLAQGEDGRRVALKVLRPHVIGDEEARERLAREVSSLTRVRSPRVAEVLDADPWGATPYIATRYVSGPSLHDQVRTGGPITDRDLAAFAAGLAEALEAVHAVGVLHRDVKPSNVLLEGRTPVLIDFGLARVAEDSRLTHTGWLLGTPGYLAPEILYGDDATAASDVHSWAATIAFAAVGRSPFGRGPAMAVMDRVRRGQHDLTGVPPRLLPLLTACLHPDPRARPTLPEIGHLLRSLDAPAPTRAFPVHPERRRSWPPPAGVMPATREPYQTPPDPRPPRPEGLSGGTRMRRGLVLLGLLAGATSLVAAAPYVGLVVVALAAWFVRFLSWTATGAAARRSVRGPRWYDGVLTLGSTPLYLVVALGGSLVLTLWSWGLVVATTLACLAFAVPLAPVLVAIGTLNALASWVGPGSSRLRHPVRRWATGIASRPWLWWVTMGALVLLVGACLLGIADSGVRWAPASGAPWRAGTLLGGLVGSP